MTGRFAIVLLIAAAGCASPQDRIVSLSSNTAFSAEDYESVLGSWTRSDEVYVKLDNIAFIHATFHSPEFRRAFFARHPAVYGPGSEEASRLLLTKPEGELQHEFFMSAATANPKWNEFDSINSIWRITLQGDEREAVDVKAERIKTTANLRVIYPYISDYARTYALHFPLAGPSGEPVISPTTRKITLKITSALGTANMIWRLAP